MRLTQRLLIMFLMIQFTNLGCKSTSKKSEVKQIIGTDDRVLVSDPEILSRIGLLDVGTHKCNASMSSPNTISTAGHCLSDVGLDNVTKFHFTTADGVVSKITRSISFDVKKDIATFQIDQVSAKYFNISNKSSVSDAIIVAGYDEKSDSWLQSSCKIEEKMADFAAMTYECDTVVGMSGSAVLKGLNLVGIHVAYSKSLNRNLALDLSSVTVADADIRKFPNTTKEWGPKLPCWCCNGSCDVKIPTPSFDWAIEAVAKPVAAQLAGQAEQGGWTKLNCVSLSAGAVYAATTGYSAAICAVMNVAAPACVAFLTASGGVITGATCVQLCQDRRLSDCK